jgi:uncharacterized membrane-anchored protein
MQRFLIALLFSLTPLFAFAQNQDLGQAQDQNQNQGQDQNQQQGDSPLVRDLRKLNWQDGPTKAPIGDKAFIQVPKGYTFLGEQDTGRFLELMGNPRIDHHYMVAPEDLKWFAVFSFEDTGYVKDDEKIDADALMQRLKDQDGPENERRRSLGIRALYTDGWEVPPHYDAQTKRLEWGTRLRDDRGNMNVNYTSRLLGKSGVMSAVLVSDVGTLAANTKEFQGLLADFSYNPGETYAEFKSGDKMAEYGLGALILGGAAAVAAKKGFWAVLGGFLVAGWKLIAGVAAAGAAGIGRLFKKKQ